MTIARSFFFYDLLLPAKLLIAARLSQQRRSTTIEETNVTLLLTGFKGSCKPDLTVFAEKITLKRSFAKSAILQSTINFFSEKL